MSNDESGCGHSEEEHDELHDLVHLVHHVQRIENPRVALIVAESGEVHFATTLPAGEAAEMLMIMAQRVRRYGGNYVHDHFDRGSAARWN